MSDAARAVSASSSPASSVRDLARERKRRQRARESVAASIEFIRTDASLFLHPDRLSQKAGASKRELRRMALKELVDNALDAGPSATLTALDEDTFIVTDTGPGIDPAKVATMFSVTRPMMSSKLIRRPTRGMVGNGNRVVAGAAFASGGSLIVESMGTRQELSFDRTTGDTIVTARAASAVTAGTKITIRFGPALPRDEYSTAWGDTAIQLAGDAATPMLTHPSWYSEPAFREMVEAAQGTAQDLAGLFGVDLRHALRGRGEQAQSGTPKRDIDPDGAARSLSLDLLKSLAPKPPKLIAIAEDMFDGAYKAEKIEAEIAGAKVPAIVQVWATEYHSGKGTQYWPQLIVNRTPAVAEIDIQIGGSSIVRGCGMPATSIGVVAKGSYGVKIAITTPAIALISDGKTPDLAPFRHALASCIGSALRRAHRPVSKSVSIKVAAFDAMEDAYLKASAGGTLPANARQIMYAARPIILQRTGSSKLKDAYFTQNLLPAFMEEFPDITADWDVVYDARGHFVEPHTGSSVPLGTIQVREYLQRRPRVDTALISTTSGLSATDGPGDRYGAVLFIEKEGFEPLIRAAQIAERFDIGVMSTKGMSVIAARKMVDRISAAGAKILVAHDLDMAGIRIFGTLGSDSARYRFTHEPDIRRLGLTYAQADAMKLQAERQEIEGDHRRILDGLREHGATPDELHFIAGGERVELNAMPSDVFVAWIEQGLRDHGVEKVVPDADSLERCARQIIGRHHLKKTVADLERAARDYAAGVGLPADLADKVRREFESDQTLPWEEALERVLTNRNGVAE